MQGFLYVQHGLVVMAGWLAAGSRRVVASLLADSLELGKLGLLVLGEMGKMACRVLHRLDSAEVGHGRMWVWRYVGARGRYRKAERRGEGGQTEKSILRRHVVYGGAAEAVTSTMWLQDGRALRNAAIGMLRPRSGRNMQIRVCTDSTTMPPRGHGMPVPGRQPCLGHGSHQVPGGIEIATSVASRDGARDAPHSADAGRAGFVPRPRWRGHARGCCSRRVSCVVSVCVRRGCSAHVAAGCFVFATASSIHILVGWCIHVQ